MKNTRLHPYICNSCYHNIQIYGYPCVLITELIWAYFLEHKKFTYKDENVDNDFKIPIAFLEKKRILISTEIENDFIQVLPNLSTCTFKNDQYKFCWCRKD